MKDISSLMGLLGTNLVLLGTLHSPLPSQKQGGTVEKEALRQILASGGQEWEWGDFDLAEYIAAQYGERVRAALISILQEPTTRENATAQRIALLTGQFQKTGVPLSVLLDFARHPRRNDDHGELQFTALWALSMRPDSSLLEFWSIIGQDRDPLVRQVAVRGLACAGGTTKGNAFRRLAADTSSLVAGVATFYQNEETRRGAAGLLCGGIATRVQASVYPQSVRPDLRDKAKRYVRRASP